MEIKVHTDDLVSVAQAARELSRPKLTIYRWAAAGKIIGIKLAGVLLIPRTEVERIKMSQADDLVSVDQTSEIERLKK